MLLPKLSALGGAGLLHPSESHPMDHDSNSSGHTNKRFDPFSLPENLLGTANDCVKVYNDSTAAFMTALRKTQSCQRLK